MAQVDLQKIPCVCVEYACSRLPWFDYDAYSELSTTVRMPSICMPNVFCHAYISLVCCHKGQGQHFHNHGVFGFDV